MYSQGERIPSVETSAPGSHIQGWMSPIELQWLHDTAATMKSVVEIGCWKGRSTYALCASGCPRVIAVDHFKGSAELRDQMPPNLKAEFLGNVGHFGNLSMLSMSSGDAATLFELQKVDMVFIDGSHDEYSVVNDLYMWYCKARKMICGHDASSEGVRRALAFFSTPARIIDAGDIWYVDRRRDV